MTTNNKKAPPIFCVVGKSDSGKTTLIEKLIAELKKKNYRVATIKHDAHSFEVDHPGKDSWRHREAGADAVIVNSPQRLFLTKIIDESLTPAQIRDEYYMDYDLVVAEGYKRSEEMKIEIHRSERSNELICNPETDRLIAVASDSKWDLPVPVFHIDDAPALAAHIEKELLRLKKD